MGSEPPPWGDPGSACILDFKPALPEGWGVCSFFLSFLSKLPFRKSAASAFHTMITTTVRCACLSFLRSPRLTPAFSACLGLLYMVRLAPLASACSPRSRALLKQKCKFMGFNPLVLVIWCTAPSRHGVLTRAQARGASLMICLGLLVACNQISPGTLQGLYFIL